MKTLIATVLLAAAVAAPPNASVPPTEGGVKCHHSFKKS
jgi:hypothetical protein